MTKLAELRKSIGSEIGVSDWHTVDQQRIDEFAQLTGDTQYIHVDPVRAADTPFGGTIAHGFLTLSLLPAMFEQVIPEMENMRISLNYGFNRLRFVAPVPEGSRLRAAFSLQSIEDQKDGSVSMIFDVRMDIENGDKPALVAQWVHRYFFDES